MGGHEIGFDGGHTPNVIAGLRSAGNAFELHELSSRDDRSSIPANSNSRDAFNDAQNGHMAFAGAILASASQINTIVNTFTDIDIQGENIYNSLIP